eukprot:3432959-Amphidinium_carterae.1
MLSGRSTVVAAGGFSRVEDVLEACRERLGLADNDGAIMELWDCSGERVPDKGTRVRDFPGVQPTGEISKYQLLLTQGDRLL